MRNIFLILPAILLATTLTLVGADADFGPLPPVTQPAITLAVPQKIGNVNQTPAAPAGGIDVLGILYNFRSEATLDIIVVLGFILTRLGTTAKNNATKAVGLAHTIFHELIDNGVIHPDAKIVDIEAEFYNQFTAKYVNQTGTMPTPAVKTLAHATFMKTITEQGRGDPLPRTGNGIASAQE